MYTVEKVRELLISAASKTGFDNFFDFSKDDIKIEFDEIYVLNQKLIIYDDFRGPQTFGTDSMLVYPFVHYFAPEENVKEYAIAMRDLFVLLKQEFVMDQPEIIVDMNNIISFIEAYEAIKGKYPKALMNLSMGNVYIPEYGNIGISVYLKDDEPYEIEFYRSGIEICTDVSHLINKLSSGEFLNDIERSLLETLYMDINKGVINSEFINEFDDNSEIDDEGREMYQKFIEYIKENFSEDYEKVMANICLIEETDYAYDYYKYKDVFFYYSEKDKEFYSSKSYQELIELMDIEM